MGRSFLLGAVALVSLLPCAADAATFTMRFSGAAFGNGATAVGGFTITDAELARINATPFANAVYSTVSDLTLTVSGAASGNGVFTTANFGSMFQFNSPSPLDFSRELVGQLLSNGRTFGLVGQGSPGGDFNLFGNGGGAPNGVNYYTLQAGSQQLGLVSLSAIGGAVPEPATWAMMIGGFGLIGAAMRRRATAVRFA